MDRRPPGPAQLFMYHIHHGRPPRPTPKAGSYTQLPAHAPGAGLGGGVWCISDRKSGGAGGASVHGGGSGARSGPHSINVGRLGSLVVRALD